MRDRQRIRHDIKQLQRIKTWQLVSLLIIAGLISATFLRLNNIGMVERRNAVQAADEHGSNADIKNRLYDLQRYSSSHMNANTGSFYLQNQYNRDSKKIINNASGVDQPNGNIYAKASKICDKQFGGYSQAYQQCFISQIEKYPAADKIPDKVTLPRTDLYKHEFLSPAWTPDFAGWSLLVCVLLSVVIVLRLVSLGVLRLLLRRRYKSI